MRRKRVALAILFVFLFLFSNAVQKAMTAHGENPMPIVMNGNSEPQAFFVNLTQPPPMVWSRTYGTGNSEVRCVIQTLDGGYALAGYTETCADGGFWLIKTDPNGNELWNRTYGGGNGTAQCVIQTSDGGYALAGATDLLGAGDYDFWLVKTDAYGNEEWNKTYGGAGIDYAYAVIQTSDGFALAGVTTSYGTGNGDFWLVKTDLSGNPQWNQTYSRPGYDMATGLVQTSDGGFAIVGQINSYPVEINGSQYSWPWLVKTDGAGNEQWNRTYGTGLDDYVSSLIKTSDGGYAMVGHAFNSGDLSPDFWLSKVDSNGNQLWSQTYGGARDDVAYAGVQTYDGGYALAGYTQSFAMGAQDFWLVKTDADGNMQWSKAYGTGDDFATSLVQTGDGGYALAGAVIPSGAVNGEAYLIKTAGATPIPEFPSAIVLLLMMTVLCAAMTCRKKRAHA